VSEDLCREARSWLRSFVCAIGPPFRATCVQHLRTFGSGSVSASARFGKAVRTVCACQWALYNALRRRRMEARIRVPSPVRVDSCSDKGRCSCYRLVALFWAHIGPFRTETADRPMLAWCLPPYLDSGGGVHKAALTAVGHCSIVQQESRPNACRRWHRAAPTRSAPQRTTPIGRLARRSGLETG
jgi:hypothetical protein